MSSTSRDSTGSRKGGVGGRPLSARHVEMSKVRRDEPSLRKLAKALIHLSDGPEMPAIAAHETDSGASAPQTEDDHGDHE